MKRFATFLVVAACHARAQPQSDAGVSGISTSAPTATASAHLIADAAEAGGAIVIISKRSMIINDMPILALSAANGIDAKYTKPGDAYYVVPLALELAKIRALDQAEATLIIDKAVPYRTVAAVLHTLEQTGFARYHFMVLRAANEKDPAPPTLRHPIFALPPITVAPGGLALSVRIDASGFTVRTSAGGIAPGCNSTGSGVTLSKRSAYDFEGLTACARAIRTAARVNDSNVTLTPEMDIAYEVVIQTMDALRKDDAGDLFPDANFTPIR